MELLKQRILKDGKCLEGGVLKVDSFINHQMDPVLMMAIAEEFAKRFSGAGINKILTIEASGIAPAIMTGYIMKLPVVFAKKKKPSTILDLVRQAGAELAGMGFIIEKEFQHGRDALAETGVRVESLAIIESLDNCTIKIRQ